MSILETHGTNCRDCYKCIRYCPLKSIAFADDHAGILDEQCLYDGLCTHVCPQGSKEIVSEFSTLEEWVSEGETVVFLMGPSYLGLRDDPFRLNAAALRMGVFRVEETAWAVPHVSARYWEEDDKRPGLLSACPAVVRLVEVHYPKLLPHLLGTVSPMLAHGRSVKQRFPGSKTVYIDSCVARKWEQQTAAGDIDLVLTFQELYRGLRKIGINVTSQVPVKPHVSGSSTARQFPLEAGWERSWQGSDIQGKTWAISGFQECIDFLEAVQSGNIHGQWANLMLCPGGCLGGAGWNDYDKVYIRQSRLMSRIRTHRTDDRPEWEPVSLENSFAASGFQRQRADEAAIQELLAKGGKEALQDQLDCGACGYDSCREMAVAVLQGKAQLDMCIPSSRAQAESMSNIIIKATPNGIIVVDPELTILSVNPAAEKMFQCKEQDIIDSHLSELIETLDYERVRDENRMVISNKTYDSYGVTARQIIFPVEGRDVYIGIFIDITKEQKRDQEVQHLKSETLQRAGEVIEKQMRVAQEIAGLLGETTGETKILLTQLMRLMDQESDAGEGGSASVRGTSVRGVEQNG